MSSKATPIRDLLKAAPVQATLSLSLKEQIETDRRKEYNELVSKLNASEAERVDVYSQMATAMCGEMVSKNVIKPMLAYNGECEDGKQAKNKLLRELDLVRIGILKSITADFGTYEQVSNDGLHAHAFLYRIKYE